MSLFDFIKKTNLENLKDRSDLEGLIKVLNRKKDFSLRRQAAKILGEIGDQKAVGSLIKALNDSDPIVRECAVTALGNIGDKKSVSSLIKKLEDEEWSVRWQTVIALGKIREESSIDPLLGMLKDEDENIRSSTANSLVNFGKLSVNPLVELLKNENNFVKKQSIYSLIKRAVDNNKQALQPKFQKFFDLYFVQEKSYHELNQNIITAIKNNCCDTVQSLLDSGANVNYQTAEENTLLSYASYLNHTDIVRILLGKAADPNAGGEMPLAVASMNGNNEIVKMLLDYKANVNTPNVNGYTPLHDAAERGHAEIAKLLIEHGAIIDKPGNNNATPLHFAAQNGHISVVKILLESGANLDAITTNGEKAKDLALRKGHFDVVDILIPKTSHVFEILSFEKLVNPTWPLAAKKPVKIEEGGCQTMRLCSKNVVGDAVS